MLQSGLLNNSDNQLQLQKVQEKERGKRYIPSCRIWYHPEREIKEHFRCKIWTTIVLEQ